MRLNNCLQFELEHPEVPATRCLIVWLDANGASLKPHTQLLGGLAFLELTCRDNRVP